MWRDWFNNSNTVWSGFLPKVVSRVLRKRVRVELEQVWDIRLDLLLDMVDECWTEEQEMSMAIKIERASKQHVWREFEVNPILLTPLSKNCSSGHIEGYSSASSSICQRDNEESMCRSS